MNANQPFKDVALECENKNSIFVKKMITLSIFDAISIIQFAMSFFHTSFIQSFKICIIILHIGTTVQH